jgi:hypothetical protein
VGLVEAVKQIPDLPQHLNQFFQQFESQDLDLLLRDWAPRPWLATHASGSTQSGLGDRGAGSSRGYGDAGGGKEVVSART